MQMCPVLTHQSFPLLHAGMCPDLTSHIPQLEDLLLLLLSFRHCCFHSLLLIHFFHRAHRSQLINDRMETAN